MTDDTTTATNEDATHTDTDGRNAPISSGNVSDLPFGSRGSLNPTERLMADGLANPAMGYGNPA